MTVALIIEDHPLFGTALLHLAHSVLGVQPHLVSSAEAGLAAIDDHAGLGLVIMDLGLPGKLKGKEAVAAVRAACVDVPLLVVSGAEDAAEIEAALAAGAHAYISKRSSDKELADAIRQTTAQPSTGDLAHRLTERQQEILRLLCDGLANKEIADRLGISEATIKMHMTAVLRALGVASRTQAVLAARRLGLA